MCSRYLHTKFNIGIDIYGMPMVILCHGWKKTDYCADSMQYLIADQSLIFITDNGKKFLFKMHIRMQKILNIWTFL